jgi:hypothetical protein
MMRVAAVWIGLVALLCLSMPASGQQQPDTADVAVGRILGRVVDAGTRKPIEGASVRLSDADRFAGVTDRRGSFVLVGVPRGVHQIVIEHIGYGRGTHLVNVPAGEAVTFDAELEGGAIRLDSLVITARVRVTQLERVGFNRRARHGFGHFFLPGEVESGRIREAIYSVPRLELAQMGPARRQVVLRTARGSCVPAIYMDGTLQAWADGHIEQVVIGRRIDGMEVYRGMTTPPQFSNSFLPCGAIVVWTRRPGG